MKRVSFAAAALLGSPNAFAQDHLEPEDSVYQSQASQDHILCGYHRDVVRKFSELYGWGISIRAIIVPPFEAEYAFGFSSKDEGPKIVGLRAETQLYSYWWLKAHEGSTHKSTAKAAADLRASIPPTIDDVALTRCEISIAESDRSLYQGIWRKMLFDTRYPERYRFGMDYVSYHFSGDFGRQSLAGQIWQPEDGARTQRFTKIAETLFEACSENSAVKLAAARQQADALCAEIGCAAQAN